MSLGTNILLFLIILFGLIIYTMICGNNKFHRDGLIGSFYKFIFLQLPIKFQNFIAWLCPKLCKKNSDSSKVSCLGEGGPCKYFIAVFFVLFYIGMVLIYFIKVVSKFSLYYKSPIFHQIFTACIVPWPLLIFFIIQRVNPGVITEDNVESYLEIYPYDNVIYKPHLCSVLKIPAVARSRYCKFTLKRVAKYDHYCPWVLCPIGEKTHRFFFLFLISCFAGTSYVSFEELIYTFLRFSSISSRIRWTNSLMRNVNLFIYVLLKIESLLVGALIILIFVTAFLLVFIIQQAYFISINKTQIELEKYEAVSKERQKQGIKEKISNFYSKGLISNWSQFWFPPEAQTRPRKKWENSLETDLLHQPKKYYINKKKSKKKNKKAH